MGVGAQTCLPSRSTQICSTPTLGVNTKNMLDRFSIHQINALIFFAISQKFYCRKEAWAIEKLLIKKEKRKKELRKNGQVSKISKTMGTQMPALKTKRRKKEMNKIAHVFLQGYVSKF